MTIKPPGGPTGTPFVAPQVNPKNSTSENAREVAITVAAQFAVTEEKKRLDEKERKEKADRKKKLKGMAVSFNIQAGDGVEEAVGKIVTGVLQQGRQERDELAKLDDSVFNKMASDITEFINAEDGEIKHQFEKFVGELKRSI